MIDPDFSGVDPLRLPEARRRVAEINDFLAIARPTAADVDRHAAAVGVSRFQFYRLAKVWREHRDPSLLVIRRRGASARDYGISERAVQIAREEIATAGGDAELATIAAVVQTRCRAAGVEPPSKPTLWSYIMKARAGGTQIGGPPRVLVGRAWFNLTVDDDASNTPPSLLAAVLLPERIIVAHQIAVGGGLPDAGALVAALAAARRVGAPKRRLLIDMADRHVASKALAAAGLELVPTFPRSVQRQMAKAFGDRIGRLKTVNSGGRIRLNHPHRRTGVRQNQALSRAEVEEAIETAIRESNAAGGRDEQPFDILNG